MGLHASKCSLTANDLEMLHMQSHMSKEEILVWHEDFIQQCPSGKMDKKAFLKYYEKFKKDFCQNNIAEIADRCFAAFDMG